MTKRLYKLSKLEKNIVDNLRTLKANINRETNASEKTMIEKIDKISKSFEEYKKEQKELNLENEETFKEKNARLTNYCNQLKKLSGEALEIYSLYEALMDLYDFGAEVLDIQRIRSIGNIVSSFASKENKFVAQTTEDLNNDEVE